MKLRPVQLVCLALLLATLRLADPAALAPDDFALRAGVLNVLLRTELAQDLTRPAPQPEHSGRIPSPAVRTPREASVPIVDLPRAMSPPAGHSAAIQSHTSFLRA